MTDLTPPANPAKLANSAELANQAELDSAEPAGLDLVAALPVADAELARLGARLAEAAHRDGLLEVAYDLLDSPIGPLMVAATEHGLVRVAFECEGFDAVRAELSEKLSPRLLRHPGHLAEVASQLREYFAGVRTNFDLPLDRRLSAGFRGTVQTYLQQIRYGQTSTYKQVADAMGSPGAVRAVGTACATNPIPIVLPCHRVLRSDGGLGGYRGGLDAKTTLLLLEHAA